MKDDDGIKSKKFLVSSGFGILQHKPFVQIVWGSETGQLSPKEARNIALMLLECADAAVSDAFVFEWGSRKINLNEEQAGTILVDFRMFRRKLMLEGLE